jgi:glycosyltransferase involved in cell wall biosynthesis
MALRVLFTHNVVAPYRLPIFEALAEDFDVTVLFCTGDDPDRKWNTDLDDYSFNYRTLRSVGFGPLRLNYSVLAHLLGGNFDAFILSDTSEALVANITILSYAKARNIPCLVWTEVISSTEGQEVYRETTVSALKTRALDRFREFLYQNADAFVAYSSATASYLNNRGIPDDTIFQGTQVIPQSALPEPLTSINIKGRVVLYVGYLNHRKGVDTLVKAFQKMEHTDTTLVIVGTGPAEDQLQSLASSDPNIRFTGYVTDNQKAAYFDAADVFVLPTRHDAWGLVVNEAMHYGVPVIVSEAAGAIEVVNKHESGCVVPTDDIDTMSDRLEELLEDPERRTLLSRRACKAKEITDIETGTQPFRNALSYVLD